MTKRDFRRKLVSKGSSLVIKADPPNCCAHFVHCFCCPSEHCKVLQNLPPWCRLIIILVSFFFLSIQFLHLRQLHRATEQCFRVMGEIACHQHWVQRPLTPHSSSRIIQTKILPLFQLLLLLYNHNMSSNRLHYNTQSFTFRGIRTNMLERHVQS